MSIQSRPAVSFLTAAAKHMDDRAATRDCPNGERSMGRAVNMYNAMTGGNMTEEQGWKFMVLLKLARSAQGECNPDDFEDAAAYAALAGEAATAEAEAAAHKGEDLFMPPTPVHFGGAPDLSVPRGAAKARRMDQPAPRADYDGRSIFPDG